MGKKKNSNPAAVFSHEIRARFCAIKSYLLQVPVVGGIRVEMGTIESICLKPSTILRAVDPKKSSQLVNIITVLFLFRVSYKEYQQQK